MAMMPNRNPLLATQGLGASAFQQGNREARVLTSAGGLVLPSEAQRLAGAGGAARQAAMMRESAMHGLRTAQQHVAAEQAQAPVDPQEFVMRKKMELMAARGMLDPANPGCVKCLPRLAEMVQARAAQ